MVRVVTDSTADLPPEWCRHLGIEVVPLWVHFGEEQFLDQVDMDAPTFFQRLARGGALPRTSQPSPDQFQAVYRRVAERGETAVSIHISERLSGTLGSARTARELEPGADVRIVDSRLTSVGLGLVVMAAALAAAEGADADAVERVAREAAASTRCAMALDTLEFLEKNGRIGKAQAWLGTMLSVKPLITLEDGAVAPLSRVRGKRSVIPELVRIFREGLPEGRSARVLVAHGGVPWEAEQLAAALRETGRVSWLAITWVGPVIGSHTGPGVLGFAAMPDGAVDAVA